MASQTISTGFESRLAACCIAEFVAVWVGKSGLKSPIMPIFTLASISVPGGQIEAGEMVVQPRIIIAKTTATRVLLS